MASAAAAPGWGLYPTLLGVSSYTVFALAALAAGAACYFWGARRDRAGAEHAAIVLLGALLGAGLGARLPFLLLYALNPARGSIALLLDGKTMLGGLIGGLAGAWLAKRVFHIRTPLSDAAAPAAALGFAIGRFGCLGVGCCYGAAAVWGVDLGDGVLRLPTQIFEIAFHGCAFVVLCLLRRHSLARGALLPGYLGSYLVFRYLTEFLRESPAVWAGQTPYQLACLCGLAALAAWALIRRRGGLLS